MILRVVRFSIHFCLRTRRSSRAPNIPPTRILISQALCFRGRIVTCLFREVSSFRSRASWRDQTIDLRWRISKSRPAFCWNTAAAFQFWCSFVLVEVGSLEVPIHVLLPSNLRQLFSHLALSSPVWEVDPLSSWSIGSPLVSHLTHHPWLREVSLQHYSSLWEVSPQQTQLLFVVRKEESCTHPLPSQVEILHVSPLLSFPKFVH